MGSLQGTVEVVENIVEVFEADADAHHVGAHGTGLHLLIGQL